MLKKKNIAMVMAAATVATSVAPVFAAVDTEIVTDEAKLIADVKEMLETRYTNSREDGKGGVATEAYQNSVYEIVNASTGRVIESIAELKTLIEENKVNDTTLNITVIDKGHKVVDGITYATEKNEYVKYTTADIAGIASALTNDNIGTAVQNDTTTATITLKNTSVDPIVVTTDDYKLDLSKPVDKDGNLISVTADVVTGKKVVGFKTLETGKVVENDIPAKVVAKYDFRNGGYTKIEANITEYIENGIYTEAGAELVNTLVKANDASVDGAKTVKVVKGGKSYTIICDTTSTTNDLSDVEANKDGGYKLTVNLKATEDKTRAVTAGSNVQITIKSDSQKELADLRAAMVKNNATTDLVEAGKGVYTTLAGDDRFETAIEISKESYKNHDDQRATASELANAVVLVGENAIVDGLAAAPLAKQKDAPILLTKKDAVGETTLAEMKRVVDKGATVYLVGGEAVISKDVEAQLIEEMNAKIVRLAGEDRFETSTEIAKAMMSVSGASITEAFVVGGDGEADAMSIASVASSKTSNNADSAGSIVAPIIVTPENGLTKDAKHFVEKYDSLNSVDVIGGEAKVSTQVLKDLKSVEGTVASMTTRRIAGETRQETNAEVIKMHFSGAANTDIYVAKDGYVGGNDKLIDALAVAPLAGRNSAPIVLATEDLTKEQAEIIDERTTAASTNKLTKVGNGISATVMNKLVKLLGL